MMTGKRRVFYSSLSTETNTFSNIPTTLASFEEGGITRGTSIGIDSDGNVRNEFAKPADYLAQHNARFVFGLSADAPPGAPTNHEDYLKLRGELLDCLREAAPIDAVSLFLHGAMISTECFDCEGDVLGAIREEIGPEVPLVAVLDPHAHLTEAMVENSDCLIFMKEYPHIDGIERHVEALQVVVDLWNGDERPRSHIENCELIGFFPTQDRPMSEFVERLSEHEKVDGITSISFVQGFPWGDNPDLGAKVLVYGRDLDLMQDVAARLKYEIRGICHDVIPKAISVEEAISELMLDDGRLRIFGDVSDNAGGGAPSDSTFILQSLLKIDSPPVLIGCFFDPEAVQACHQVGVGGQFQLLIGGKLSTYSGDPVELPVQVMALGSDIAMDVLGLVEFSIGDTAWVRYNDIDIVLISVRIQTYSPHAFTHLGIELECYRAVFVKSTNHFRATFGIYSDLIQNVSTPGAINFQLSELKYQNFSGDYLRADASRSSQR